MVHLVAVVAHLTIVVVQGSIRLVQVAASTAQGLFGLAKLAQIALQLLGVFRSQIVLDGLLVAAYRLAILVHAVPIVADRLTLAAVVVPSLILPGFFVVSRMMLVTAACSSRCMVCMAAATTAMSAAATAYMP
ncbi:MAG TPA: hypothetical protein VHY20_13850, partial [Pirellulales bacterium]|nr:hypothetical protein [Pirellulales bacterium]